VTDTIGIPGDRIRSFIERREHIDEEIKVLSEGKKEIFGEAKGQGFDVKVLKKSFASASWARVSATSTNPCSLSTCGLWRTLERRTQGRRKVVQYIVVLAAPPGLPSRPR
jgi:hypothetical protein